MHMTDNWSFGKKEMNWPLTESGEKEKAVLLERAFDSIGDAEMTISLLDACGIPCFPYYGDEGAAGRVINGFSGLGAALYVPESRLDEAKAILVAEPVEKES